MNMNLQQRGRSANGMNRRSWLKALTASGAAMLAPAVARADVPQGKMKITRVRVFTPPNPNPVFNQSDHVVTIETDAGLTGVGEGGSKEMLEQCAGRLIGKDPHYIERLWQDMTRAFIQNLYARGGLSTHQLSGTAEIDGTPLAQLRVGESNPKFPDAVKDENYHASKDGLVKAETIQNSIVAR